MHDEASHAGPAAATLGRLSSLLRDRPPRFGTTLLHEAQSHLRQQDDRIALRVRDAAAFRGYRELHLAALPRVGITLGCIEAGCGYELSFQSRDEMLVNIPLRGRGWVTAGGEAFDMSAGQILLIGPSCRVAKHWQGPGEVLSLHVPLAALEAGLALPPYLPPITLIEHDRLHALLAFIEFLIAGHDGAHGPLCDPAVSRHAEGLVLALLMEGLALCTPAAAAAPPCAAAVPYYVRRAEQAMRAHAGDELSIDDLAEAAGVSTRSLQYGFRKAFGSTPMLHFKRLRLELAREKLERAGADQRCIRDVALAAGFGNVSQFSRDYRAMFGQSPSETLSTPQRLGTPRRH